MRWPRTRPCPGRWLALAARHGGFTLLEVMVVVTIIGIVAGMVAMRVGDSSLRAHHEREARRLQQAVQLAAQEAIVRGRPYGLAVHDGGYEFCRLEQGDWKPIGKDAKLRPYDIPANLHLRVDSTLPDKEARGNEEEPACPMVRLMPSGEIEPIRIAVLAGEGKPIIDVDVAPTGKVTRQYRHSDEASP